MPSSSYSSRIITTTSAGEGMFFKGNGAAGGKVAASSFARGGFDLTAMKKAAAASVVVPASELTTVFVVNDSLGIPGLNLKWFWMRHGGNCDTGCTGFNISWARLHVLGYDIYISQDSSCESDVFELLVKPVRLVRDNELLDQEFVNTMHALQVVHFYCWIWKGSALLNKMSNIDSKVLKVKEVQREKISGLNSVLLNDNDFASKVFCNMPSEEKGCICFDWSEVLAAVAAWEDYASNLSKQIHLQLPYWRMHESIYNVQLEE